MNVFDAYSPFIREFIYSRGWDHLNEIQVAAADVIFNSGNNLLLPSQTASGKTEAAFFPILSQFYDDMPKSVGAIYIAPLKSLINDQFGRISELCDQTGIPVYHWHGDVAASHKNKVMKVPQGILQITPESLEGMLIHRNSDLIRIFGDLRYVIIDEIHTLTGTDRGNQILCQLARLRERTGVSPRRIGLSATIGDMDRAAAWLGASSGHDTVVPEITPAKIRWRLGMEHFYIVEKDVAETPSAETHGNDTISLDPGYEYIYDCTRDRKAIVFSNSREETEYITATLRQIAEYRGEPDVFLIHHGFLSASIREDAELKMKDDDVQAVVCATVTMELGIDIGRLERVIQQGSPNTVSSFLQRLGRSGRRGDPPEMMMVFREENPLPNTPLPQLIPWELLKAIAVVQLYIEERFIEPPNIRKQPLSLLFQQTLSVLAAAGALSPAALAERVLSLPPFQYIEKDDYKTLMLSMIRNDWLEMTEEKELILGLKGERLVNSFKFYAVFKDNDDYTVRCESDEIGVLNSPPPVGDRFALAGRVWEVEELDLPRHLIYVKPVKGKMEVAWPGDYGEVHTKILERMRQVLMEDTEYPYLKEGALRRLRVARNIARNTGLTEHCILCLGGSTWALFPWLGTRSFRTLRRYLKQNAGKYRLTGLEFEGCYYMTFKLEGGTGDALIRDLSAKADREGVDLAALIGENEAPVYEKYDEFIPSVLLRKAYRDDKLRSDEFVPRLRQIAAEPHMPSAFDTDVMTPSGFRNTQTYGDAYIRQHTTDNLPTPPGFEPDN
ncbi:MAG: DEAD/DEAH box helicase [Clostridia bacterium]|nr:DEAD/DEAH box helicase [Clostridia bacterium]